VAQATYSAGKGPATEFHAATKKVEPPNEAVLEPYRARWTLDTPIMREARFRTENTITQSRAVAPKFWPRTLRAMPGVPGAVERLRDKIVARQTAPGARALRDFELLLRRTSAGRASPDALTSRELSSALAQFGVSISRDDVMGAARYFATSMLRQTVGAAGPAESERIRADADSGALVLSAAHVLGVLRGDFSPPRLAAVDAAWLRIDAEGAGSVPLEVLLRAYEPRGHPAVRAGKAAVAAQAAAYRQDWESLLAGAGVVTRNDFEAYLVDVSAGFLADADFADFVAQTHP
jgi:hypothetical protein